MSRSKAFFSGAALTYLHQASAMIVGVWLTPFYLRVLGAHDYGLWLVGLQVLTFLLLCDLGVLAVVPRDVAQAHGRELTDPNSDDLHLLFGRTIKVVLGQTILVGLLALLLFLFRPAATADLRGPVGLVLLTFILTYPGRVFSAVLQGLQDLAFLGQVRVWSWAASVAIAVVLLLLGARFYALAWGWCVQEVAGNLTGVLRLRRLRPDLVSLETWKKAGSFRWQWLVRGAWVSVGQIANSLVGGTDLLIVARVFGPATVVIYSCTAKLTVVLQQQPQVLASVALPGLSQMKTSEPRERIRRAATCLTQAMVLMAGGVFSVVLALNQQFVNHWTGSRYFGGLALTGIFVTTFVIRIIDYTLALALFAFGYEKLYAIRTLLDGLLSVTLAAVLSRSLGLEGVALGFLCGAVLIAIPMDFYLFAREFEISLYDAVRPYIPYLWRCVLVGLVSLLVVRQIDLPNLFAVIAAGLAVGTVYLLVVMPHARKSELRDYIQPALASLRLAAQPRLLNRLKAVTGLSGRNG